MRFPLLPTRRRRAAVRPCPLCIVHLDIAAESLTTLRQIVFRVAGDALRFVRAEAYQHNSRMRVALCLTEAAAGAVVDAVGRFLPDARLCRLAPITLTQAEGKTI
jgi:hypothetical protein